MKLQEISVLAELEGKKEKKNLSYDSSTLKKKG